MMQPTLCADRPTAAAAKALAVAPATVVIGPDTLSGIGELARRFGRRALVVSGPHTGASHVDAIAAPLAAAGIDWILHTYDPDCTEATAAAAARALWDPRAELVIGLGGGKAMDLAKLVADAEGLPCLTVPTSAATCAAWTALGNFYLPSGAFAFGRTLSRGPTAVLVDTTCIARAPARLLASGLADTMAKWVETSASVDYATADMTTRAAWRMARFLFDEVRDWGEQAYREALKGELTPAVARAIETNICLAGTVGGLGGERCRSVAAHAVCNALTNMSEAFRSWHGEKVAFGIVTQRVMEGQAAEAAELAAFFARIGIPVTLRGLGYDLDEAGIEAVATHVARPGSTAHHLPFPVTPERVRAALVTADELGRSL